MTDHYTDLQELIEQLRSLVERADRLPRGAERRAAFEEIGTYRARLEAFSKRMVRHS